MDPRSWYLVSYDIRDDARLRRVAKLLEGYGQRLQYSVFRCRFSPLEMQRLKWELTRITETEDGWMIVPVCGNCLKHVHIHGGMHNWPEETPSFLVL